MQVLSANRVIAGAPIRSARGGERYVDPQTWQAETPVQQGSWWPEWHAWLDRHSTGRTSPPRMGAPKKKYASRRDAPICRRPSVRRTRSAWKEQLASMGVPPHLVAHLATMALLHQDGRYDRFADDVKQLTGEPPMSVRQFVQRNAAAFTAAA
jgi:hypothetical protein